MKRSFGFISAATCLIALSWSQVGLAQGNCGDIQFSGEIGTQFPNARDACLDIVERDGQSYAHFVARILRVRGNEIVAEFRRPDGTFGNPVAFTPAADARVRIEGRSYRYRDLSRGQELSLYLPPDRWEIAVYAAEDADFETAPAVTAVPLREPSPEVAALPRTATSLPMLALAGVLLMGLGAVVAGVRRLRRRV